MKIALITDTHFGIRGDNRNVLQHQIDFFNNNFFPTIDGMGIDTIVHLGDLVDRRKYINFETLRTMREEVLEKFKRYNTHIICGNHDVYYKHSNRVNALVELVGHENCSIYMDATTIELGGKPFLMLPWINEENQEKSLLEVKQTQAKIIFGHLELAGFEMYRGTICAHGMDRKIFTKFDRVLTGHFHERSKQQNVYYLGAPYQMTWGDFPSKRGFHIFDTETNAAEFIENKESLFRMIVYDDSVEQTSIGDTNLKDCYVKVLVQKKENPYQFDTFITQIEEQSPNDVRIIEQFEYDEDAPVLETEDTPTVINRTIDSMQLSVNKDKLKARMQQVYNLALTTERETE